MQPETLPGARLPVGGFKDIKKMQMSLVTLKVFDNRITAEMEKSILENHGIFASLKSDDVGGMNPQLNQILGVELLVNEKDKEHAEELLRETAN